MTRLLNHPRRALVVGATLALLVVGLMPGATFAANPPIHFEASYGNNCISGKATLGSTVDVTWRDSAGALKVSGSIVTTNGRWQLCGDGTVFAAVGDRLKAADGTFTRKFTLPEFSVAADRVNDVFYGTGPANRTLVIEYPAGRLADYTYSHYIRPGDDGRWTFRPTDLEDIEADQFVWLSWVSPNKDTLEADASAAGVTLILGKAKFRGTTTPFASANFALRDGSTNVKLASAAATADPNGNLAGQFRDSHGNSVIVAPGQRFKALSFAADADWIVPNITGSANKAADTVTGSCMASGYFTIEIMRSPGHERGYLFGHTSDPNGNFVADFADPDEFPGYRMANIKSSDRVIITCRQPAGDNVQWSFRVP